MHDPSLERTELTKSPPKSYWSTLCRLARAVVTEIGKNSPTGDYYSVEGREEPVGQLREVRPHNLMVVDPTTSADPYGIISRWKLNQGKTIRENTAPASLEEHPYVER